MITRLKNQLTQTIPKRADHFGPPVYVSSNCFIGWNIFQPDPLNPENPDDGRTILSGVQQIGDIMTITVNFPGVFILVSS